MTRRGCKETEIAKRNRIAAIKKFWEEHPESRVKQAIKMSGDSNPSKLPEVRRKHSESAILQWSDPEARKRQSENKKKYYSDPKHREEQSIRVKKIRNEHPETCYFKTHPEIVKENYEKLRLYILNHPEVNEAQSLRMKVKNPSRLPEVRKKTSMRMKNKTGPNSTGWRGGKSFEPYCYKFNEAFKEYIRNKFNRKCFICGKDEVENNKKLFVHHIDYNKSSLCKGNSWGFVPLCNSCHSKTNGKRWYWFNLLINYWINNSNICFEDLQCPYNS